jgi:putative nucleotidyltransferase with HDIG domain
MKPHLPTEEKLRYHLVRWAWVPVLALVAHVAFPSGGADIAPLLEPGARADKEIVAPFNFVVNKSEDELQREAEELAASAKPIYEFRQHAYDSVATTLAAFFSALEAASDRGPQAIIRAGAEYGIPLTLQDAGYLSKGGKRRALQQALQKLFDRTLAQGVTGPGVLQGEQSRELIVRRGTTESSVQRDQVLTFTHYKNRATQLHPDAGSSVGDVLYLKLTGQFFRATLIPKPLETERRRNELRGSVDPSKYIVRTGDRIVGVNEIVTNEAHERLVTLHQELLRRGAATTYSIRGVIGPLLRDSLIIAIFWVLLAFYRRETYRDLRQVSLIGGLFAILLVQAGFVAHSYPAHPEIVFMPFVAMMMTVLFNGRVSMIAAMILSVVVGMQPIFHDVPATFLCVVGGVSAALSVKTLRSRSNFYAPVLIIAAGYFAGALALGLSSGWPIEEIGLRGLLGTLNGLVSAGLTFFLLPVAESVTHITTDLTLLELSDPSRPLLRRLSVEAPGTYAHSVAMANLVEAACNRIGANGLLGRVGCYYHDIGKVKNPVYFVENQIPGNNPHDRLKPLQSAQIIKAHVTDGLALAAEADLPDSVAAFIPEHHGTTEITYFLDKAKKSDGGQVRDPAAYVYPGPKPRSMETAISMIADSVEAALRVLEDLTPQKIEEAIGHIVRTKVNAGQLDEAPLTLQQIEQVKSAFLIVLSGMYHNRIDYPESTGGISAAWQPPAETARTSR